MRLDDGDTYELHELVVESVDPSVCAVSALLVLQSVLREVVEVVPHVVDVVVVVPHDGVMHGMVQNRVFFW